MLDAIVDAIGKPYFRDDSVVIYHADCRDILPKMPQVDLVLTSPPYNIGLGYGEYKDDLGEDAFHQMNAEWLAMTAERASDGARLYIVVSDKMLWWIRGEAESAGWKYHQLLTWCKPNLAGVAGRISGDWNYLAEPILLFRYGKRTPMMNGEGTTHNYFVIPSPQSNWAAEPKEHPAQWPLLLARRIISRTPGDLILDPFMGSGTTLRAAKDLGRFAVGIEIEERFCEIAAKRMSQTVMAL